MKSLMQIKLLGFYLNFILFSVISLTTIMFGEPIYGTTDDNILAGFVSGSYTGQKEFHLIFIQPIMGYILFFLQYFIDLFDIYSWTLLVFVITSFSLLGNLLFKNYVIENKNKHLYLIWIFVSSLVISWFTLIPTYTSASILVTSTSGIVLFSDYFTSSKSTRKYNFKIIIISLFFISGYLIRPEGFLGTIILFTPMFLVFILLQRKFNFLKFLLSLAVIFIVLICNLILKNHQNNDEAWRQYNNWNDLRHQIQHRNSQNYLNLHLQDIKWTVPEYHLFMDLAFGDQNTFNANWIEPAFIITSYARGIDQTNFTNINKAVNILLLKLSENLHITFLYLLLIFIFNSTKTKQLHKFFLVLIIFIPLFLSLLYMSIYLHTPDRVIQSILLIPIFLLLYLISLYKSLNVKNQFILLSILTAIFIYFLSSKNIKKVNDENVEMKKLANINKDKLIDFSPSAKYLGPGHTEIFNTQNPYFSLAQDKFPVYNTVGNWDTFSPHWFKRNKLLNFNDDMVYLTLFNDDVYWISNPIPETGYILELYLIEKGFSKVSRTNVSEFSTGLQIIKFRNE